MDTDSRDASCRELPQAGDRAARAGFRLAIADALHDDGPGDRDLGLFKINVIPLQRQQLADAQPREHFEEDRRVRRLPQQAEQRGNLLHCEHNRDLRPLRTLANMRDRIPFVPFPPDCVIKDGVHYVPHFALLPFDTFNDRNHSSTATDRMSFTR
jgi:hypothetical protein